MNILKILLMYLFVVAFFGSGCTSSRTGGVVPNNQPVPNDIDKDQEDNPGALEDTLEGMYSDDHDKVRSSLARILNSKSMDVIPHLDNVIDKWSRINCHEGPCMAVFAKKIKYKIFSDLEWDAVIPKSLKGESRLNAIIDYANTLPANDIHRQYIREEFGKYKDPRVLPFLISDATLYSDKQIISYGDDAKPYLLNALSSKDPKSQRRAISFLGNMKCPEAVDPMIGMVTGIKYDNIHGNDGKKWNYDVSSLGMVLCDSLVNYGENIIDKLEAAIENTDIQGRIYLYRIIGRIGGDKGVRVLKEELIRARKSEGKGIKGLIDILEFYTNSEGRRDE